MEAQLKQKWIEALRSGKYEQTQGQLKKDGAYCCLGVLCELAGRIIDKEGQNIELTEKELSTYDTIGKYLNGVSYSEFVEMNDDMGYNFNQIADYIIERL